MKLLAATVMSLSLLAPAYARTNQAGAAPGAIAAPAAWTQDSQAIKITRSGMQPHGSRACSDACEQAGLAGRR